MEKQISLNEKELLSMFAREFDFSVETIEDRRRTQRIMYVLNSAGFKTGYSFSLGSHPPCPYSDEIIEDIYSIFSNHKDYEKAKEYSFYNTAKQKLTEIKELFLNPIKHQKQLELLACSHYILNNHYRKTSGLFHQFKKNFKKQNPHMQILGSKIKTNELKQTWIQAANLIAYRNYYDSLNPQ